MISYHTTLTHFWRHHPATLYALVALISSSAALYFDQALFLSLMLFPLMTPLFYFPYQSSHYRILLALILGAAIFGLTLSRHTLPSHLSNHPGVADVEISSISVAKTPFGTHWKYKGWLNSFTQSDQVIARNLPITISFPFEDDEVHPRADLRYHLSGRLTQTSYGKYILKPTKDSAWIPASNLFSLAEWRFFAKQALHNHIQESIRDPHVGAFLAGIATGEFDDRLLATELSRFGLQHLMAISGLHFSILATLIAFFFALFFSRQTAAFITIVCMSAYFLFLGVSPSVTRAWMAIFIGMASLFIERNHSALNALGIAALCMIILNPLVIEEIGFQFSFATTTAILIGFSPCDAFLQRIFGKRPLSVMIKADSWDRHGYCLLYFLRQSLALCLAVNSVALPLTLYHFQKFPLMSLIYNLFIPGLISISLGLLVLACSFAIVFPWLGSQLHAINEAFTQFVLNFAFHLPKSFDWTLQTSLISKEILLTYLLCLFCGAVYFEQYQKSRISGL